MERLSNLVHAECVVFLLPTVEAASRAFTLEASCAVPSIGSAALRCVVTH